MMSIYETKTYNRGKDGCTVKCHTAPSVPILKP